MEAIEESSFSTGEHLPTKRPNKNISNLTINLNFDGTINPNSDSSSAKTIKSNVTAALDKGEMNIDKLKA